MKSVILGEVALALMLAVVGAPAQQLNPAIDVHWPTCGTLQAYAPGTNTCFTPPVLTPLSGATSHEWMQYIDSSGTQHLSQPSCEDLSDAGPLCSSSVSSAQIQSAIGSGVYAPAASGVPSGMIGFIASGTCPSGWTELSSYAGEYVLATKAANSDVGTTGGSSSYTPAGTVAAPVFTGSSVTTSAVSAGTPAGTNSTVSLAVTGTKMTTSGSGTAAATGVGSVTVSTSSQNVTIPAETFTGSALATHTHNVTAAGTNSAPAFTGTAATIRPPYIKLIPCQKN